MTATLVGTRASVAAALRRVWPKHTAKIAARVTGKSVRAGEEWVQGNKRGDWDALIKLMAASDEMERQVLALVAAERGKRADAGQGGAGGGMGAAERGAGPGRVAGGAAVPGAAPAGVPARPGEAAGRHGRDARADAMGQAAGEAPGGPGLTPAKDAGGAAVAAPAKVACGERLHRTRTPSHDNQQGD